MVKKIGKKVIKIDEKDLKIKNLKTIIYNQQMVLYHQEISNNCCPWGYRYIKLDNNKCIGKCAECKEKFWKLLDAQVKKEIEEL